MYVAFTFEGVLNLLMFVVSELKDSSVASWLYIGRISPGRTVHDTLIILL